MDTCQLKYQNIGMKIHNTNLIKFTQLFISLSLFSFIFSPSSFFVFLHYFKFYFSTLPFQLYTHNIDKNSMFLLCNALLVFVGLTISFSYSSCDIIDDDKSSNYTKDSSSSLYIEEEEKDCSQSHVLDVEANESMLERDAENKISGPDEQSAEEEEGKVEEENIEKIIMIDEEEEEMKHVVEEEVVLFDANDEEGDKGPEIEENDIEEYYVEAEEESSMLSIEELNKKFEEFIRKMKKDIRIDSRRQC